MKLTITSGTITALTNAGTTNTDKTKEHCILHGDLNQMGTMANTLQNAGFDIKHTDVYPVLQGNDIKPGLQYLYDNHTNGWWNQKENLIKYGICTTDQYKNHFKQQC